MLKKSIISRKKCLFKTIQDIISTTPFEIYNHSLKSIQYSNRDCQLIEKVQKKTTNAFMGYSSNSQTGRRESCCICRCQIRSVPRNFIMEKYCLEELLVNRLRIHTSQCNMLCNNCPFNFYNLSEVKFGGNFCPPLRR